MADLGGNTASAATEAIAITPADTDITATRGIYVGGAGDVAVRMNKGKNTVTFKNVPAGTILPVQADRILAATSATDIVAMW